MSTVGSSEMAATFTRKRLVASSVGGYEQLETEVPQPLCVNRYFLNANAVDVHNQARSRLDIESTWRTWRPIIRQFSTILSIASVDAYRAYLLDCVEAGRDPLKLAEFIRIASMKLATSHTLSDAHNGMSPTEVIVVLVTAASLVITLFSSSGGV